MTYQQQLEETKRTLKKHSPHFFMGREITFSSDGSDTDVYLKGYFSPEELLMLSHEAAKLAYLTKKETS